MDLQKLPTNILNPEEGYEPCLRVTGRKEAWITCKSLNKKAAAVQIHDSLNSAASCRAIAIDGDTRTWTHTFNLVHEALQMMVESQMSTTFKCLLKHNSFIDFFQTTQLHHLAGAERVIEDILTGQILGGGTQMEEWLL